MTKLSHFNGSKHSPHLIWSYFCLHLILISYTLYGEVNSVKNTTINIWLNDGVY